jgi:putative endonuclease
MSCATHIAPGSWCLYLLECRGGLFYAGITNRLQERFAAHQAGKGAKFTRANPPVRILGARPYADRSEASKAEYAIKKLPRGRKLAFLRAA